MARSYLDRGPNPESLVVSQFAQGQAITFGQVADQVLALKRPELRATTAAAWVATFALRHCRELREKPVALIDTADILTILEPFSPVMGQQRRPRLEAAVNIPEAYPATPREFHLDPAFYAAGADMAKSLKPFMVTAR